MTNKETTTGTKMMSFKSIVATFFTGIAALAPVVGTILLVVYLYRAFLHIGEQILVDGLFGFLNFLRGESGETHPWEFAFPGDNFVLLALPLALFFGIGWGVKNRLGAQVLAWIDAVMTRMPLLGFVYGALKQFIDSVRNFGGEKKFKSVAYVEYPSPGCRLLGFVTGSYYDEGRGQDVTTVFVPTSPNPATGFVIVVDNDKLIDSGLSLEEAGKMILSAGLVNPSGDATK